MNPVRIPGLRPAAALLASAALLAGSIPAAGQAIEPPRLDFEKHVLSNGLNVILHEDHSVPIVAVNLWYHVGSKNEKPGRTGFAHLFEHMMFQGSEHFDSDFFKALEPLGATDLNGTTNYDRTNYFENVPTPALERVLWLEADRMGWLLPALTQERLDNQIEVVKNERRQSYENRPYGLVRERMYDALYPSHHPYSWPVIGSMDDLSAASLEDVQEFFRTWYGPGNATLVVAGDIDPAAALETVKKYFGAIPPGPPLPRTEAWVPVLEEPIDLAMEDRVPLARLYLAWHSPGAYRPDEAELDLLAGILAGGKTSRLYKRLVYDMQIAQDVRAFQSARELSSLFQIMVTAKPGVSLDEIEAIVLAEIEKLRSKPPAAAEVERERTGLLARVVRGLDRIGGFGGKSDLLGRYNTFVGDPGYITQDFARYNEATAESVQAAARRWLHRGRVAMHVTPYPDLAAGDSPEGLDRASAPPVGDPPALSLPRQERAELSNGLQVVVARTDKVPAVTFSLVVRGGYAATSGERAGQAAFMADMLDEGTTSRSALEISEQAEMLGARLDTDAELDSWTVELGALTARLQPSLELWADVILNPAFPADEIDRRRKQAIGRIMQEKSQPTGVAFRLMPGLLFGQDHPYGQPLSGSGTEAAIQTLTREDLVGLHRDWFRPGNATVVVVGDITRDHAVSLLEKALGSWKPGATPLLDIPERQQPKETVIHLVDKPGAAQSVLLAGNLAPPRQDPDDVPLQVLNTILGGQFTSRLNMNLREDKGYTYGARTRYADARGPGAFIGFTQVRTDVTRESLAEMMREFRDIRGPRPATVEEVAQAQDRMSLSLPGQYESLSEITGKLTDIVTYDLPPDYYDVLPERVRGTAPETLTALAARRLLPDQMVVVVVGDRQAIEPGLRELELGEVRIVEPDPAPDAAGGGSAGREGAGAAGLP